MRKVLKWIGIVIGGLLALIALAVAAAYFIVGERMSRTYDIQVEAVPTPAAINRGERDWPLMLIGFWRNVTAWTWQARCFRMTSSAAL